MAVRPRVDIRISKFVTNAVTEEPLFIEMLERLLVPQLSEAPKALIAPFGESACKGALYLGEQGLIDSRRVLRGFLHPSGANGHRKRIFQENRTDLVEQLKSWFRRRT